MTQEDYDNLYTIATVKPWLASLNLKTYLKTVEITEEAPKTPQKRTGKQNDSLHLWFRQCADACQEAGVDAKIVFSATMHVEMTELAIKTLWHALQTALLGTTSTTELPKHGKIDRMVDHMRRFFAERIYVNGDHVAIELPPFPHEDKNTRLQAMENLKNQSYPQHSKTAFDEENTIT